MSTPLRYVRYKTKDFKGNEINSFLIAPGPCGELVTHSELNYATDRSSLRPRKELVSAGYFSIEIVDIHTRKTGVMIHGGLYLGSESLGLKPLPDDAQALHKFLFNEELV
jgi:hypothetical protein